MTSGTYRHYYDNEGKRYSHIIDARSKAPVTHDTVSVTLLHDDLAGFKSVACSRINSCYWLLA